MERIFDRRLVVLLAVAAPAASAQFGQPHYVGEWAGPFDWSGSLQVSDHCIFAGELAHAALLPVGLHKGKVLLWNLRGPTQAPGCPETSETTTSWIFDPAAVIPSVLIRVEKELDSNIFCAGLSFRPGGDLLIAGGQQRGAGGPPVDIPKESYSFDPARLDVLSFPHPVYGGPYIKVLAGSPNDPWTHHPLGMGIKRYYATLIGLTRAPLSGYGDPPTWQIPGGSSLVIGGPPVIGDGQDFGNEWYETLGPQDTLWGPPILPVENGVGEVLYPAPTPHFRYELKPDDDKPDVVQETYPRAFQLSSGDVFISGDVEQGIDVVPPENPPGETWGFKPPHLTLSGKWELWNGEGAGQPPLTNDRFYGTAVLRHTLPERDRVLVFGGSQEDAAGTGVWTVNKSVQEFDPGTGPENGQWFSKADMLEPRIFLNAVTLPTGDVFLVGGSKRDTFHPSGCQPPSEFALQPELYSPGASSSSPGSSTYMALPNSGCPSGPCTIDPTPRLYHSLALLLPDGRVLVAGGEDPTCDPWVYPNPEFTAEIFSPPYMFVGPRPILQQVPRYTDFSTGPQPVTFDLTVESQGGAIDRVVLLRPGAVTHHFDNDQRYIELAFTIKTGGFPGVATLEVDAPDEALGPPGWYLIFAVADVGGDRTPTAGEFIKLL